MYILILFIVDSVFQRSEVLVIEEFVTVSGVEIEVNVPENVKNVYEIHTGKKLNFSKSGNKVIVRFLRLQCILEL